MPPFVGAFFPRVSNLICVLCAYLCVLCVSALKSTPPVLLKVEALLSDLVDLAFGAQGQIGDGQTQIAQAARLREYRIRLAIHLLQEEIQALADFALAVQHGFELVRVGAQAHQLIGDIAASCQDGRSLGDRSDIAEELMRLRTHADQLETMLN